MKSQHAQGKQFAHHHVSTLMHEISLLVAKLFNRQVREFDLTRSQWQVLYLLYTEGPLTQTQIAERLMMAKPPLGKIIDRLQDGSWVERMPDETDKRVKRVVLTDKIRPLLRKLENVVEQIEDIALKGIPTKERDKLAEQLRLVRSNLRRSV